MIWNILNLVMAGGIAYLIFRQEKSMDEINKLIDDVTAQKTVADSAVALLNGLTAKINTLVQNATDLADLKAKITAVTTNVESNTTELSDAVVANTPAAPGP